MIVGSVLLIAVAAVLLVVGLIRLDDALLASAIGVSVLAAVALVVGTRRLAAARRGTAQPVRLPAGGPALTPGLAPGGASARPVGRAAARSVGRATPRPVPVGEPAAEPVPEDLAAILATLPDLVQVIDGRPRFHRVECIHLLGREHEPLPAVEAVELGFTPCGLCRPAGTLLAGARSAAALSGPSAEPTDAAPVD